MAGNEHELGVQLGSGLADELPDASRREGAPLAQQLQLVLHVVRAQDVQEAAAYHLCCRIREPCKPRLISQSVSQSIGQSVFHSVCRESENRTVGPLVISCISQSDGRSVRQPANSQSGRQPVSQTVRQSVTGSS